MIYNCLLSFLTMARECNIDARGKFVRLVGGSISLAVGLIGAIILILGVVPTNFITIGSVVGMLGGGALGIYEGRSGWCVARAMGIWTPI